MSPEEFVAFKEHIEALAAQVRRIDVATFIEHLEALEGRQVVDRAHYEMRSLAAGVARFKRVVLEVDRARQRT